MHRESPFLQYRLIVCCLLSLTLLQSGCDSVDEKVSTYDVTKHELLQTDEYLETYRRTHPDHERMYGVVIPQKTSIWFFKLQGKTAVVGARESELREFLKSVRFPSENTIAWDLPTGWKELPATEMRYATLVLNGEPPLEMSVTTFPARPDLSTAEQVVMNVNRWRNQFGLPPIESEDLDRQSEKLMIGANIGYWTNIVGRPSPKSAPMMSKKRQPRNEEPAKQQPKPNEEMKTPQFDKPTAWTAGPPTMFAALSFQIQDGDSKAAVTVTPAKGNPLDNVNRWRGQLGLGAFDESDLAANAKRVDVGSSSGNLYEMSADGRTIFGVIADVQGQTWFIKLVGDTRLAERERQAFEGFLKSLRFQ